MNVPRRDAGTATAAVLGIPVGTVKSRLTAARTALGRVLNEKGRHA